MPPISKISKDMILDSGFEIIRNEGIENLNVRNIANKLNCSTQLIMYHYKNMDILKEELYDLIDMYHSDFLIEEGDMHPLLNIGLQYIKFAHEEKNFFKFLFQNDKFSDFNFDDFIKNDGSGILSIIQKDTNLTKKQLKEVFTLLFIMAHGIACLLANNSISYDEEFFKKVLKSSFNIANNEDK